MWKRVVALVLLAGCALPLFARGRARGYQAGAGVHRPHPVAHKKNAPKQTKKTTPPPAPSALNF